MNERVAIDDVVIEGMVRKGIMSEVLASEESTHDV